ncbi:hypothetical protein Tco_0150649 [Tanacetum coccineum]
MADQRTVAELLRTPTEGYAEAIVVPPILAEHFELKHSLINMMTFDTILRLEKTNPHDAYVLLKASFKTVVTTVFFLDDELAHITFPPGNDDLPFDAESNLRELEYLLNHDPIKDMDSILEDLVDENSLDDNLDDTIYEMFTDEHALDYSSPPLWDDYDDNLFDHETDNDNCDSVSYEDFSEVDVLSSTNNKDKVFNPGILIHENLFEVTNCATMERNVKKTTNASLILEDFNPPHYELLFHKEVSGLGMLLFFSSENKEKVFNPGILTSKRVHTSLLPELSHQGTKAFKVTKILESPMEIFPRSYQEDICVLDVPISILQSVSELVKRPDLEELLINRKSFLTHKRKSETELSSTSSVTAPQNSYKQRKEELDSAYERFQHILSMLELHDATVSIEDANLKFLRSLPSVWHVVATMIRGQPGLDELDFDDLYNNLKVYEHELKGVSNSNSQNIAFLSTEVKGSTFKHSTAEPTNISHKDIHKLPQARFPLLLTMLLTQMKSYVPSFLNKHPCLQLMMMKTCCKLMKMLWKKIDISECRFVRIKENRANGRQEKESVAIEDSNSKALVATDNNEDIDWTKEFDAEPVTYAMMALTGVEQDDWSMEFDAEHVHFGQDGLGDFDWSNKADDAPVSLALMATNSEVPYCSKCSKSYKKLLESYQTERDNFQRARTEILGYQMSLESLEVMLKTHEKNEYAWGDKYEQMEYDLKIRDLKLEEKQKELDQALKERDDFKVKLEKWSNASVLQNEVLNKQRYVSDKSCIGFGIESSDISSGDETLTDSTYENFKREKAYKAVPPPTGTIIPPRANVSFTGIDELAIRNKVVNQEKTNTSQSAIDRNKVIIEDWVDSDDEETDVSESQKETVFNTENSEESFENRTAIYMKEPSNTPKLINLREHRVQGEQDQFGTTSKE